MKPDSPRSKRHYPLNIFILVTLLAILLAIWYVSDYLGSSQTGEVDWYQANPCQLPEETCQATLEDQHQLVFDLNSDQPTPLEPLPVRVELKGYTEEELQELTLELDLQGRDMYMGYNRTPMEYQGEGVFTAAPLLGICTDDIMIWRASVLIHPDWGTSYGSYFDFTVVQKDFR
ncbi:hypothetical protein [Marinospirillum perlucidum]|uniref:hypothetical protein n=1 Tax=Marinospirillum perlucidum TaxID=1982602 RepID=UPI000DF21351|nr:hypothetical protein [Marinospirillum perlucidum]